MLKPSAMHVEKKLRGYLLHGFVMREHFDEVGLTIELNSHEFLRSVAQNVHCS
jgi:hypothetical protein